MMLPVLIGLAVLLALALLSSALNLALRNFSRYKLGELLEKRGRGNRLARLVDDCPMLVLTTSSVRLVCNLGIMLVVVWLFQEGFSADATPTATALHYLKVFAVAAALILIVSVAIPNAWARYAAEPLIAPCIPALHALRVALSPIVSFLHLFDGLVRRLAGAPKQDAANGADRLEKELLDVVSEGERHGVVDEEAKEMIESVIELRDRHADSIMTPRTDIVAIEANADFQKVRQKVVTEGHSRLPVFDGTIDTILGVLYAKDLISVSDTATFDARKVMRQVPFIPETKSVRDLLHEFQEKNVHIAIVLDEYGGTAGIVTIEDILEELVGEITDEYEEPEPEPIQRLDAQTVEVDARVNVAELNDELRLDLPEDGEYDTVGGFVFSHLGRIPRPGDEFEHANLRFKIVDAEERRVKRVRVQVLPQPQQD